MKEATGAENRKTESHQKELDKGVSVLGAFKLDCLQTVKLNLSQNVYTFLPLILGAPISYYCRKEGRKGHRLKMGIRHRGC